MNGTSVLAIAGVFALISAASRDRSGAVVGLLVAAAGAVELHGAALLRSGRKQGMHWLVASQIQLATVIMVYVALRLQHPDLTAMHAVLNDEQRAVIRQTGLSEDQFLLTAYRIGYEAVAVLTLIYQGAMAFYYARRRKTVAAALREDSPLFPS